MKRRPLVIIAEQKTNDFVVLHSRCSAVQQNHQFPVQTKNCCSIVLTHLCRQVCLKWIVHKPLAGILWASLFEDVCLVEFVYLVLTRMSGDSYLR